MCWRVWLLLATFAVMSLEEILVDTVPKNLTEDDMREGYQGGTVSVLIDSSGDYFKLDAVKKYLPLMFSGPECLGEGCDMGVGRRVQALLKTTPYGQNVNCVCDTSCGQSFPGTGCHCDSNLGECQKIRVDFLPDPGYEISKPDTLQVTLMPALFSTPPWGGNHVLPPITITPTPGRLSIHLYKGGVSLPTLTVSGRDLSSGSLKAQLILTGEVWAPPFSADSITSNKPAAHYPVGFLARKATLLPAEMLWGPTPETLELTFGGDPNYNIPDGGEVITFCNDLNKTKQFVKSGLGVANSVEITVVDPFPSEKCDPPFKEDCSNCLAGWYTPECTSQCPMGGGSICSSNGECLSTGDSRCTSGCSDGVSGHGTCTCLVGWKGGNCGSMVAVAIAGTSTAVLATGSLLLEIAAGGSPAAPITAMTQIQLIVLLGVQPCMPTNIKALSSSVTWVMNPFYGVIKKEHDPTDDAMHLFQSYMLLVTSVTLHMVIVLVVYGVKHRSGWTLSDATQLVWFPNFQFLIVFLLLYNSVSSSAAIITQMEPYHPSAIIAAIVMLLFYVVLIPGGLYWFITKKVSPTKPTKRRAQYLSRNVANSRDNAARVVYTHRRAALMPRGLRYFLPMGFWTSRHLPDRGFCRKYGILFDEYREKRYYFMLVQVVKFICCSFTLGLRESSDDEGSACKVKLWFLLMFLTAFAITITYQQPYSSRGTNLIHSTIAWCNAACLASIISDIYANGGSSADKLLLLNTILLIISALWSMLVFVLGKTIFKVKYVVDRGNPLRRGSHFLTSEKTMEEIKGLTQTQASHVGEVKVKANNEGWKLNWCELRGVYLLRYPTAQAELPIGGTDVSLCRVEYEPKKGTLTIEDIGYPPEGVTKMKSSDGEQVVLSWLKALSQVSIHAVDAFAEGPVFSARGVAGYYQMEHIGSGAFGEVTKVLDKATGLYYAMKKITPPPEEAARVHNEIAIMQLIQHPFIASLVEAIHEGESLYLVMELLKGGDLAMHLKEKGNLTLDQVRFYMAQVLCGIEHLHENSILYRDLKPANIVLDKIERPNAILTDMGIATVGAASATFCGTPYYLAPEVIQYKAYDKGIDWWSLGIVIYELLVGYTPFAAEDQQVTFQMIEMKAPTFPDYFPPDAKNLVGKLLRKKPTDRLTNPMKIKKHPFFKNINFTRLVYNQLTPPEIAPLSTAQVQDGVPTFGILGTSSAAGGYSYSARAGENPIDCVFTNRSRESTIIREAFPEVAGTMVQSQQPQQTFSMEMSIIRPSPLPE
eukprot:TRINITY_DN2089_c0_g2_i1.p1 TRINITY_DN2089_c0_g2~~TRINITY_DN2089_c0_g2_i1.p1  ORF type:complete len:1269 (+),score=255.72 TRINITY_DN2089_c0_g2_i1:140-3946(+)